MRTGRLDEATLDAAAARVLRLARNQAQRTAAGASDAVDDHHGLAHEAAIESMVLLHNDGILPIATGAPLRIGVVGNLAFRPRIQGIGSSQVQPTRIDVPWSHLERLGHEQGHELMAWDPEYDESGLGEAQLQALPGFLDSLELVLVFAGQPLPMTPRPGTARRQHSPPPTST